MRSRRLALVCLVTVAGGLSAMAAGCYDTLSDPAFFLQEPSTTGTGGAGGTTTTIDPGCVPGSGGDPVADDCGVFVSSSKGNDANVGSKTAPFATIAKALGAATGKPIYLCGETFTEAVEIKAGALVYGALACATDWKYASDERSVIAPAADAIPLRVTSKATLEIYDVDLTAADATVSGGSSIAMLAESATDVTLTRAKLVAGSGAPGADGAPFDMPATGGGDGKPGNDACSMDVGGTIVGGGSVQNACDADSSVSGAGGIGQEFSGGDGSDGQPVSATNGGAGEGASACTAGTVGDAGMTGPGGPGASGLGSLTTEGITGVAGGDGQPGKVAQGGGGGGGAKGGAGDGTGANKKQCGTVAGAAGNAGASGASGGAGGCGGTGGKGGGAGGSSIGVVTLGAKLSFETVQITTANGGKGGSGGLGQAGGDGGKGAAGGKVPAMATDLKPGCAGGDGGKGGDGGTGGGGLGGHSIGIAHTGDAPATTGAQIVAGTPGDGGTGDGDTGTGAKGTAAPVQAF